MTSVGIHTDQLFFRIPGGIGTYVRHLLPALRDADPELDLSVFHSRFEGERPAELDGFKRIQLPRHIRTLYPMWNLAGRPALPGPLAAKDVIHAPSPVAIPPVRRHQRLVVTVHDVAFLFHPQAYPPSWRRLYRAGLRRASRTASALIAVSQSTADDIARLARVDPAKIHVTPLGGSIPIGKTDLEPALERLGVTPPYVLFVGTLEPRKNVVRLIQAFRRVAPDVPHSLVLAGPLGWGSRAIQRELELRGKARIVLTGRVSEADLDVLYRGATAFAYPSVYEGFGLPVLDAMQRGIPVLTSDSSSLPELAGDAAIAVSPWSTEEIAEGLRKLLAEGPERTRLSTAGVERARAYTWERTARETLAVYEKVAG